MPFFTSITDSFHILPRAFGLDISDNGLKFVYLQKHRDEYEVRIFGEHMFSEGIVQKGKILNPPKLAEELQKALSQERGLPRFVVLGLPEEEIFIRVVQMPQMERAELSQAIRWEIEGNIPLSIDDVYYAYQSIESLSPRLDHVDVLVAAAPKDAVDDYMKACVLAGLQPIVVEPASVALARALIPSGDYSGDIVLLDMGAKHTRIAMYTQGALRFTSSISLSLEDAITNVMRAFSYDHREAERMLFTHGLSKSVQKGKLFEAIIPMFTDFKEQIEKYINFQKTHHEHEHGKKPTPFVSIIIAGGGALIPGMDEYLSEALGSRARLADPWANLPLRHKGEIPRIPYRDAIRFASCVGLALRGAIPPQSLDENSFFSSSS